MNPGINVLNFPNKTENKWLTGRSCLVDCAAHLESVVGTLKFGDLHAPLHPGYSTSFVVALKSQFILFVFLHFYHYNAV